MSGNLFALPIRPPLLELNVIAQFVHLHFPLTDLNELNDMAYHAYVFLTALSHITDEFDIRDNLADMIANPTTCTPNFILEAVRGTGALWMLVWCNIRHDQPNHLPTTAPLCPT
jgi:hypothetical protein